MKKFFKRLLISAIITAMLPVSGIIPCASAEDVQPDNIVRLNPADASPFNNGEFQGWGTSMGWWGNRIGYSDKLAQDAAKLFYTDEGLSLDIVRYNLGGGDDPTHTHVTRSDSKVPCYAVPEYDEDGNVKTDADGKFIYTYDWDADYNQLNALKAIKAANDNVHIEGCTYSPPWFMTISGCSSGNGEEKHGTVNFDKSRYVVTSFLCIVLLPIVKIIVVEPFLLVTVFVLSSQSTVAPIAFFFYVP